MGNSNNKQEDITRKEAIKNRKLR